MTIEGRPNIQGSDEYWKKEYAKQRKDRLQDSVDEYLQDDEVSILTFYNDLRDCMEEIISYHEKNKQKAQGMLDLILGHRPVDFDHDFNYDAGGMKIPVDSDTPNSYEYAADITLSQINKFQRGHTL